MKKLFFFLSLVLSVFLFASCDKSVVFDKTVEFSGANWSFEEKSKTFEVPIKGSENPYSVVLELILTGKPNVDKFPADIVLISPNGGKMTKSIQFYFNNPKETYIQGTSPNEKILRIVVYPKKYFAETGTYSFQVIQASNNADNYNIRALRLYIEKIKN